MEKKIYKLFGIMALILMSGFMFSSCSDDDDEPSNDSIVGTWSYVETIEGDYYLTNVYMTLTFNSDKTGSIEENWITDSRASSNNTYKMDFSWSTTSDSNGNDILRISYISGDKDTELFNGGESTVLWNRQYVLTGKILNIYSGNGVWVFNKK